MTVKDAGTVLITGPTSGLGRVAALEIAGCAEPGRPDLLLMGRPGETLTEVAGTARGDGAAFMHRLKGEGDRERQN
jgi:NADP-dependent 3-hydroxy acid dehydrogenase YdfG